MMGVNLVREYPAFIQGHEGIWIPQEQRRAAKKYFNELWSPVFKSNHFVRDGNCWWRVQGGQILQGIKFDPKPRTKYVDNLEVRYYLWPLFAEHCRFPPGTILYLQQHLTDYVYPGWPDKQQKSSLIPFTDAGTRMSKDAEIEYPVTYYCTFFNAMHDVKSALEAELELFCERTLPELDKIADARSYAEKDMSLRPLILRQNFTALSPAGVDTLLALKEWKAAERSLRACIRIEENIGETKTTRKWYYDWYTSVLNHVVHKDENWIETHFQENIANSCKTIELWKPRLHQLLYTQMLSSSLSLDIGRT